MGPTWGPPGSCRLQMGPCWPHEPCYQGWVTFRYHGITFPYLNSYQWGRTHTDLWCHIFRLKQNGSHVVDDIDNVFSKKKIIVIWLRLCQNWSVTVDLTVSQHWFRYWFLTTWQAINCTNDDSVLWSTYTLPDNLKELKLSLTQKYK